MSAEMGGMYGQNPVAEHEVIRLVPGDIETVRQGLSEALEHLGYRVLDENPLRARRRANGWGASGCSTDVLEYAITLHIGLKAISHNTTRATFDYIVKNPMMVEGDRHTLMREAEALIALARARATNAVCSTCGAQVVAGARFCRQCGVPNATPEPAELEVLRLTANSRAAYHSLIGGGLCLLAALAVASILFFLDPDTEKFAKRVRVLSILASIIAACGLPFLIGGFWRLHSMLKVEKQDETIPALSRRTGAVPNTASLAAQPNAGALPPPVSGQEALHSVTEGTTDLLPQEKKRSQTAEV